MSVPREGAPSRGLTVVEGRAAAPSTPAGASVVTRDWRVDDRLGSGAPSANIWRFFRALAKHRWLIIGALFVCLAIGLAVTLLTPPVYSAAATLQIDREGVKVVAGEDQTPSDNLASGDEFFQTQYGLLKSRSLASRVADALDLAKTGDFIATMSGRAPRRHAAPSPDRAGRVVDLLQKHLSVVPVRGSRLVEVTFNSPSPTLSATIANAFAENFIAAGMERQFETASFARDFLERRLAEVKAKLEESERELVAYATAQQIIPLAGGAPNSPDTAQSLAGANMEAFNAALAAATADRIRAEQRWRQAQASQGDTIVEALQSPTVQQLSEQRARLQAEYQNKLSIFKPDYPDMRQLKAQIDETNRQIEQQTGNIRSSLESQYRIALKNEQSLNDRVEAMKSKVLDLRARSIRYAILQREVDTNRTLYAGLLQRYKEVGVAGGLAANNVSIVDRASEPITPTRPRPVFNMILAAVGGVILGLALVVGREMFDRTVRVPADIEATMNLPILGAIPALKKGQSALAVLADARSPLRESYQSLRSALQFATSDGFPRTLLITSAGVGGGKSTTAFAIGESLARMGFRTLVIDADLRKPSLHGLFGLENHLGLSNILTGATSLRQTAKAAAQPNLFVVTSGPAPPNPAELLAGDRLKQLIAEANLFVDMVIFDGPPVMGLADATLLSAEVVGTLVVAEAGKTRRGDLRAATHRLRMSNANLLGVLMTRCAPTRDDCGYDYHFDYGADVDGAAELGLAGLKAVLARAKRAVAA